MTSYTSLLFWVGLFVVFYTYVGYAIVITVLARVRHRPKAAAIPDEGQLPHVTLVVAAYNEEAFIEDKIRNTLTLDYPSNKLVIFVVTDGSTDRTPDLVKKFRAVRLFHEPARRGKIHAVNRVMKHVASPIVIFSDANTLLNRESVKRIVRHYQDPMVGGVAGEKRIVKNERDEASASGEGLYWKYESYLKQKDSDVYSVVGAAGELFSIRTALYHPPQAHTIIEDFVLSLRVASLGYRFIYEPGAVATESASISVDEEWKRKVRICAGGFQAMVLLQQLLNPFRHGVLTFQYVSHRVLRWTLAPFFLPVIFLTNAWLAWSTGGFYLLAFISQTVFYSLAAIGHVFRNRRLPVRGFFVPYYFVIMNLSVYAGLVRYLNGQQSVVWEKAERARVTTESSR